MEILTKHWIFKRVFTDWKRTALHWYLEAERYIFGCAGWIGLSVVNKGASGSWTGSGASRAVLMAVDSVTGEVIAAAKDQKSAEFTKRFSKWGSANEKHSSSGESVSN